MSFRYSQYDIWDNIWPYLVHLFEIRLIADLMLKLLFDRQRLT